MKRQLLMVLCLASFTLPAWGSGVVSTSVKAVKAYPNPWRADRHGVTPIKFDHLPAGSTIKVFTVSGHEVKSLTSDSTGVAAWDRTNSSGDKVASGVYIYLIIDPHGDETSGKLAIIQ